MIKGYVISKGEHTYQKVTVVKPVKHNYSNGAAKWSCPICDALGNKHSVPEGMSNCPQCNVNLYWNEEGYLCL